MIVLIRKKTLRLGSLALCALLGLALLGEGIGPKDAAVMAQGTGALPRVILDPGHGGEDGGAVSADGTAESHLNLAVALDLEQVLLFAGVPVRMTRREDVMVCDAGLATLRQRKSSDIHNRVKMTEESAGAVLISIHQNALPASPETHGAQVFYSPRAESAALAEQMQGHLNTAVNTHRAKLPRQIPREIYLLNHVTAPAVLVECGFLSNPQETARLQEPAHQMTLAVTIAAGYLGWAAREDGT